jgi:hypothetical protein
MESLRLPPRFCPPQSTGRPSGARTTGAERRAEPSRPRRLLHRDQIRKLSPTLNVEASPPHTSCASWLRSILPPSPVPSEPCSAGKAFTPRNLVTWRRERQAGILQGLTPHKRGPKSKRNPQEEELQKLRRDNQHLTEELRKAAIVIDVQKKVGALLGWPLPKVDPEEQP